MTEGASSTRLRIEMHAGIGARMHALLAFLLAPRDIAWLAAFRILFGCAMCISMLRFVAFGWIDEFFVQPSFHFKYWGFSWVEPLPAPYMHGLVWGLALAAALVALGLFFKLSAFVYALGFAYLQLVDVTTYLNHYYLASLLSFLLALSPAHRAWSLDARRKPSLAQPSVATGWHMLLRFQVGVVYTFAGLAKAQSDWLLHGQPLGIWLGSRTSMPVLGSLFAHEHTALLMSWAGFLFDTTIAWFLLWGRSRPFAFVAVVAFHTVTGALFPIGMFPVIMVMGALTFFPPNWPRTVLARVSSRARLSMLAARTRTAQLIAHPTHSSRPTRAERLAFGVALAYCAFHLLMPLRHFAYDGSVLWHEQGMRWSWRVMVREKNGLVTFYVRNTQTGRSLEVPSRLYLNDIQEREMGGQPDLILQLAHRIADDYTKKWNVPVEVRAEALVSLNGRRSRLLIDPHVDLTKIKDGVSRAAWITPSPSDAPPHIKPVS
jgi:vitamin K-dependent gamma-carboxylase